MKRSGVSRDSRPHGVWVALCAMVLFASVGCDSAPGEGAAKTTAPAVPQSAKGVVSLSPEEVRQAGIVVTPVIRGEFRTHRDFPGTVLPNQHAIAEITALVRGRVVDVYADLGQQVKSGDLLAILYSGELGMAQSAYLKADAKLFVADR